MDEQNEQERLRARREAIEAHLAHCLEGCKEPPPDYRGKVRDLYNRGDELWLVATDRVSAFDVVLGTVPLKGALLTEQSAFWLERAARVMPTHLLERIDAQILRCKKAEALPVELVVRGHLAGSLAREPAERRGQAYGLTLDPALEPFDALPEPVLTPTTKAEAGQHDMPISPAEIVAGGLVSERHFEAAQKAALALFAEGAAFAAEQGLILVDTKYEMGLIDDELVLIDEIHTADSSRYWEKDAWEQAQARGGFGEGEAPRMLDKERLRRWLLAQGFAGEGQPPALPDEVRLDLAAHYWELTERVLGRPFSAPEEPAGSRVEWELTAKLPPGAPEGR